MWAISTWGITILGRSCIGPSLYRAITTSGHNYFGPTYLPFAPRAVRAVAVDGGDERVVLRRRAAGPAHPVDAIALVRADVPVVMALYSYGLYSYGPISLWPYTVMALYSYGPK